jgi:hypothetical protein
MRTTTIRLVTLALAAARLAAGPAGPAAATRWRKRLNCRVLIPSASAPCRLVISPRCAASTRPSRRASRMPMSRSLMG